MTPLIAFLASFPKTLHNKEKINNPKNKNPQTDARDKLNMLPP